MDGELTRTPQRRLGAAVAVSLGAHVLLGTVLGLAWRLPIVTEGLRGEPLMVELHDAEAPAPLGNPASREPAPSGPRVAAAPRSTPDAVPRRASDPAARSSAAPPASTSKITADKPAPAVKPSPDPMPKPAAPVEDDTTEGLIAKVQRMPGVSESARESPDPPPAEAPPTHAQESPPRVATSTAPGAAGSSAARAVPDIRAALPGGGGGSPGGRIGGRGGIVGEPIPLDSRDPQFRDYLERLKQMIQDKMGRYPCIKNVATPECEYRSAELLVEFGILKSGRLQFVDLRTSSGLPVYDDNSTNAIKLAAPFPSPPPAMLAAMKEGSTGVAILGHFSYIYEVSLRGLLR
jgi:outer membrane biosynthesis protein TonB